MAISSIVRVLALVALAAVIAAAPLEDAASANREAADFAAVKEDGAELADIEEVEEPVEDIEALIKLGCCVGEPVLDADSGAADSLLTFDCSTVTPFGAEKCEGVRGCKWATGIECLAIVAPIKKCTRIPKYEVHFGQRVDVGQCRGICLSKIGQPVNSCTPKDMVPMQVHGGSVMIIKECECSPCATQAQNVAVEVPAGVCKGRCASSQQPRTCTAGVADNFSTANGAEPSSPSVALLTGPLSACSAGIQPGFDFFADNRCFGHTFSNCITRGPCPLRSASLRFCLRAANVPLTNTDGMALGTNAVFHWGIGLPTLNGGTWNQGQTLCTTLDLGNLPNGGASILPQIEAAGTLDFYVQDDTAVDFVALTVDYVDCQVCAPKVSVVSTLYTTSGAQNFVDVRDCACVDGSECHREPLLQTLFPGTIFEITLDVGQCIGRCGNQLATRCRVVSSGKKEIKAPEGIRVVEIVEKCDCQQRVRAA